MIIGYTVVVGAPGSEGGKGSAYVLVLAGNGLRDEVTNLIP